jgi:hypothetical protein
MQSTSSSTDVVSASDADSTTANDWFLRCLKCLGNEHPEEFLPALQESDNHLIQLTLWLEDCVIRMWTIEKRDQLKADYWTSITEYLQELQCPACYTAGEWQRNETQRVRVIFWLLSVATNEAYGDAFLNTTGTQDSHTIPTTSASSKSACMKRKMHEPDMTALKTISETDLASLQNYEFPLGFSTGDNQVDGVLTLLRMNLLLDLEREQQVINRRIAQLQTVTVPEAKSLKKYKQRRR